DLRFIFPARAGPVAEALDADERRHGECGPDLTRPAAQPVLEQAGLRCLRVGRRGGVDELAAVVAGGPLIPSPLPEPRAPAEGSDPPRGSADAGNPRCE